MNDDVRPGAFRAGFCWHLLPDNWNPWRVSTKPLIGGEEKKVALDSAKGKTCRGLFA